jgi:hypothetical protein
MGRHSAYANGLGKPLWVRLPLEQDQQLRELAKTAGPLGTLVRTLMLEALESRNRASRNKAKRDDPPEVTSPQSD